MGFCLVVLERFSNRIGGDARNSSEESNMLLTVVCDLIRINGYRAYQFIVRDQRHRGHGRIALGQFNVRKRKIETGIYVLNGCKLFQGISRSALTDPYLARSQQIAVFSIDVYRRGDLSRGVQQVNRTCFEGNKLADLPCKELERFLQLDRRAEFAC